MFHGIAAAVQLVGLAAVVVGGLRVARAPAHAARRAALSGDLPAADRERYARGLVDFYRISGALAILAGILLVLVPVFAG